MPRRGIILTLEPRLEDQIRTVWTSFEEAGIGITPGQLLEPPHVTFAEPTSASFDALWQAAVETPFQDKALQLIPFGAFPGRKHILFYNVVLSDGLLKTYLAYYEALRQKNAHYNPMYGPGHILFHCTIAIDIEESEFLRATELISRERGALSGSASAIELWEYFPAKGIRKKPL